MWGCSIFAQVCARGRGTWDLGREIWTEIVREKGRSVYLSIDGEREQRTVLEVGC